MSSATLDEYINNTQSVVTADGRQIVIDDLVDLYREFAKTPVPIAGHLYRCGHNKRRMSLRTDWRVRDMDRPEVTKHAVHHTIKLSKDCTRVKYIQPVGQPVDVTNELAATARAPVSQYMAVVRKGSKDPESGKQKQWLEVWDQTSKVRSIDTDSVDEHSALVLDDTFGRLLWSGNGKQLLYVAEYKAPKAQSYYKRVNKKADKPDKEPDTRGQEFVHRDDWGHFLEGISHIVICILDVSKDFKIRTIEMTGYSLGQPFWTDSTGDSIGFIGWPEEPLRLGLDCPIRQNSVFTMDLRSEDSVPQLVCGSERTAIRSPRPLPDGTGFVYLECEVGGPHYKASRLMRYTFESKSCETLVDTDGRREIINTESGPKYGNVCALYHSLVLNLLDNCFTSSGNHLLINCFTELQLRLYLIDLKTRHLIPIDFPLPSVQLMDFRDNLVIAVGSAINVKPNVFVGRLDDNIPEPSIEWSQIGTNSSDSLKDISVESYWIPVTEDPNKLLTAILVSPQAVKSEAAPTIVLPHGGPHVIDYNTYMSYSNKFASMVCSLGFKTLLVNYRGSLGVDEEYVSSLIGHVGDRDVKDVIQCVQYLCDRGLVDSHRLVLYGASHGGFLVTHLSGQYPHWNFKVCVSENPVIDLSTNPDGTDIPDWCYVEAFGTSLSYKSDAVLEPMSAKVMSERSPIHWAPNVKVPTLMVLGKRDRRVPSTQGLKYYRLLKARGVKTRCYVYDDGHCLADVSVDGDLFVNVCLWILQHLNE